jgi:hypothetical protein
MSSEMMHQVIETIRAEIQSRPSAFEFEVAYQARVVIDRIKFAIRHIDQFANSTEMRDAALQLLDALQRLEALDRRFQTRSRIAELAHGNGSASGTEGPETSPSARVR